MTTHLAQLRTVVCRYWCALCTTARRRSQMSIPKNGNRRKSLPSSEAQYPDGYVLPKSETQALFEAPRHDQIDTVAAGMQLVVDITDKSAGGRLAKADLQQLKQL